jgi:hypothetical protein
MVAAADVLSLVMLAGVDGRYVPPSGMSGYRNSGDSPWKKSYIHSPKRLAATNQQPHTTKKVNSSSRLRYSIAVLSEIKVLAVFLIRLNN